MGAVGALSVCAAPPHVHLQVDDGLKSSEPDEPRQKLGMDKAARNHHRGTWGPAATAEHPSSHFLPVLARPSSSRTHTDRKLYSGSAPNVDADVDLMYLQRSKDSNENGQRSRTYLRSLGDAATSDANRHSSRSRRKGLRQLDSGDAYESDSGGADIMVINHDDIDEDEGAPPYLDEEDGDSDIVSEYFGCASADVTSKARTVDPRLSLPLHKLSPTGFLDAAVDNGDSASCDMYSPDQLQSASSISSGMPTSLRQMLRHSLSSSLPSYSATHSAAAATASNHRPLSTNTVAATDDADAHTLPGNEFHSSPSPSASPSAAHTPELQHPRSLSPPHPSPVRPLHSIAAAERDVSRRANVSELLPENWEKGASYIVPHHLSTAQTNGGAVSSVASA